MEERKRERKEKKGTNIGAAYGVYLTMNLFPLS